MEFHALIRFLGVLARQSCLFFSSVTFFGRLRMAASVVRWQVLLGNSEITELHDASVLAVNFSTATDYSMEEMADLGGRETLSTKPPAKSSAFFRIGEARNRSIPGYVLVLRYRYTFFAALPMNSIIASMRYPKPSSGTLILTMERKRLTSAGERLSPPNRLPILPHSSHP